MSETTDPRITMSIDLKKNRLRVHRPTLKLLGSPSYVQLLISPANRAIIILGCEEHTPGGQEIRVVFDKPSPAGTFDIYSKELITRIRAHFPDLDKTGLYRLNGRYDSEEGYVCFPLSTMTRAEAAHV